MYILKKHLSDKRQRRYISKDGSKQAITANLIEAKRYDTLEAAEADIMNEDEFAILYTEAENPLKKPVQKKKVINNYLDKVFK